MVPGFDVAASASPTAMFAVCFLSLAKGLLRCSGDAVVSGFEIAPVAAITVSPTGKIAIRQPSPEKGMLRRGFLLRRSSVSKGFDLVRISCGNVRTSIGDVPKVWMRSSDSSGSNRVPLVLDSDLVLDPVLDPDLVLDLDPGWDPDLGLDPDLDLDLELGLDPRGSEPLSFRGSVSSVVFASASSVVDSVSPATSGASVSPTRQFSFPLFLEDGPSLYYVVHLERAKQ